MAGTARVAEGSCSEEGTAGAGEASWSAQNTTPDAIEAALRELLAERSRRRHDGEHDRENGGLAPARVLNMVVFVESAHSKKIAERLRGVGRYHASRTVVLSYEAEREELDARVTIASEGAPARGEVALLREMVVVEIGKRHLDDLVTIADPLVVSDLPTLLWSPHRHPAAADALLELAQATLIDSVEQPVWSAAIERACALSEQAYVVDLAWLRSTPWRERIAATFDPQRMRPELDSLQRLEIRHHPDSTVAAMLFVGWLASRLGWQLARSEIEGRTGALRGSARTRAGGRIELRLWAAPELQVPGLAGVTLGGESGLEVGLDRGPGGLHAHRRRPSSQRRDGAEREWTLLGASRGEGGILGEGIRQALLRDPTYLPALRAAQAMLPDADADAGTPAGTVAP
jgi:glucose-6-phosphate dehydrogenase assembly protein OpcA